MSNFVLPVFLHSVFILTRCSCRECSGNERSEYDFSKINISEYERYLLNIFIILLQKLAHAVLCNISNSDYYSFRVSHLLLLIAFSGGYGTWSLAIAQPTRFAAIISICGGGDCQRVSVLKNLPIWNFHGKLDDVVPAEESLSLIKALDSPLCKSTVYQNMRHDSWTETYNNPEIFKWLLAQTKNA